MIALLLLASCGAPALKQTETPRQNETAQNNQRNPSDNSEQSPFFVREVPTDNQTTEHQEDRKQQALATKIAEGTAVATLVILVIQGIIFFCQTRIFGRQTRIFDNQTSLMRRQNELISGQLEVARTAADASAKALKVLNTQSVDVDGWTGRLGRIETKPGHFLYLLRIDFLLHNRTERSLTLREVLCYVGDKLCGFPATSGIELRRGQSHQEQIPYGLDAEQESAYVDRRYLGMTCSGRIIFEDAFGDSQINYFATILTLSPPSALAEFKVSYGSHAETWNVFATADEKKKEAAKKAAEEEQA
jgi:hypothetical protein